MSPEELLHIVEQDPKLQSLAEQLQLLSRARIGLRGLKGSSSPVLAAILARRVNEDHLILCQDRESAAYFFNDLEVLTGEKDLNYNRRKVLFYPASYRRSFDTSAIDNTQVLFRTEALKRIGEGRRKSVIVTYPEALAEKVVHTSYLTRNSIRFKRGEKGSVEALADLLVENNFERVDFVYEPGQFSIRGGIIDVYSFTNEYPYRIEFLHDEAESIRTFDPSTQLSVEILDHVNIVPNMEDRRVQEKRASVLKSLGAGTIIWVNDVAFVTETLNAVRESAIESIEENESETAGDPADVYISGQEFIADLPGFSTVEFGTRSYMKDPVVFAFDTEPQPAFSKNFDLLISELAKNTREGISNLILSDNPNQIKRLYTIFDDIRASSQRDVDFQYDSVKISLHEGFISKEFGLACYTDHQIFERYHKFRLYEKYSGKESLTVKELYALQPGDYITHIDHGIGRFDGLEKIMISGREQEAIRITYKDGDLLYISIHSLHRISKYTGKEGAVPSLHRLGSNTWNRLKEKTKKKVKDIAKDLIKLYAERKASEGFSFAPDTYLQHELEASFIYEDTPDQLKATQDVKSDMEAKFPMDRLVCGDVGFGKTEVAIRAAFKAVTDSKQVALLVPTTILALQHYHTFSDRLSDMPCKVEYINRFKSRKEQTRILKEVADGQVDILIGTHRILGKDIQFKDLGLLIVDEEQKFGVSAKEKLKKLSINVDTLTLTATPIPRTLQFSLMGARDLSVINTPPPNRFPVQTELRPFGEDIIRDAIHFEIDRGGQVFFVHNRIQNIEEVADMILRFVPDARIAIGHGRLEGLKLEKIMTDFIGGSYDVLVSTTIIESGLDIPNVNTIIINDAQNFGLSDLHQLRGRVGRSNKKAFCYLLTPPLSVIPTEARKRLQAVEEFSSLGSGFNIALRDLDIRGAGNILGAEQSGFISEIGYEMYHKILDEAIAELKEKEFKDLYKDEKPTEYVKDCQIETDLAILIPDDYVTNIAERLNLYRELDNIQEEEELQRFRLRLIDRFGPLPPQTEELVHTVRLRWMAGEIGFEKIVLKNGRFSGFFVSGEDSAYYQSDAFGQIIEFLKENPIRCVMKEVKKRLALVIPDVSTVEGAIDKLRMIRGKQKSLTG